ncbi:hypothetical protein BFP97_04955 [Roseivirga sp. 4D4]|uniref:hypothetical protein n=1 Tax=Roseivirga sp. 4D4 TaxID=1889784 RepID=UPI000852E96D|nr:hypothetical protein [Roseivirga sp. 4D4]OEK00898.1 hypothetical protein BFP97_04955 [Roseivirga sp. 4D4]
MNLLFKIEREIAIAAFIVMILTSCQGMAFQDGNQTWKGIFDLASRGEQQASAQFDFDKNEGVLMLPNLIPVPLNLKAVLIKGDSLFFSIGFRSGPAYCKAKMTNERIEGVMDKEGMSQSSFWLEVSNKRIIETVVKPNKDEPIIIKSKGNLAEEIAIKERLEKLLIKYDLEPYIFTKSINIEKGVIPHSHPVLTLSTDFETDTQLIATFLHEQMHWYSLTDNEGFQKVGEAFLKKYPNLPSEAPEGAGSEQSTFLHLGVCYLEFHTLSQVIGRDKAIEHFQFMTTQYYRWVYRTILKDLDYFESLFEQNGLHLK